MIFLMFSFFYFFITAGEPVFIENHKLIQVGKDTEKRHIHDVSCIQTITDLYETIEDDKYNGVRPFRVASFVHRDCVEEKEIDIFEMQGIDMNLRFIFIKNDDKYLVSIYQEHFNVFRTRANSYIEKTKYSDRVYDRNGELRSLLYSDFNYETDYSVVIQGFIEYLEKSLIK